MEEDYFPVDIDDLIMWHPLTVLLIVFCVTDHLYPAFQSSINIHTHTHTIYLPLVTDVYW